MKQFDDDNEKRLYSIWLNMKTRCNNSKNKDYPHYGGRGIKINTVWNKDFDSFKAWALRHGYSAELTLDRVDVNGNYEPSNCRWVTMKVQLNNRRDNDFFLYKGVKHTLTEWAEIYGINASTLYDRVMRLGYSFEEAITKPVEKASRYLTFRGETKSMTAWAKELDIPYSTVKSRLNKLHWTVEEALTGIKRTED